jgi:subtilisin-like proprotein convertase family protein
MSRFKVLYTAAALVIAGSIATAQTSVTNIFQNINRVIPDGQKTGMSDTHTLTFANPSFSSITDVQVTLTISGGFNGDFYGYLVHNNGFAVLLNRVGRTTGNSVGYSNGGMDVTFSADGSDVHNYAAYSPSFDGNQLTGTWAPDGRDVDPQTVLNTDSQTALLGSFDGTDPNGTWTLFLADLDFGQQGTLVQWGVIVSAIPEPSTWALMGLGGFALGMRLIRRRVSR